MQGFTYLGLLTLLSIMAVVAVAALKMGVVAHRRMAEEALLDVGLEFSQALENYRQLSPLGQPDEPKTLQDLLKDTRFPGTVRHLRKLYSDPLTGQSEWGVLRSEESHRIVGVYSLSDAQPIKIANFDSRLQSFQGSHSYQQWIFTRMQVGVLNNGGSNLISPLDNTDVTATAPAADTAVDIPTAPNALMNPLDRGL